MEQPPKEPTKDSAPKDSPPLPSATILMLRDGPSGLEVFMQKRHDASVYGGAYVFPGGKLDREDAELVDRLDKPLAELHAALGEPDLSVTQAAALHVAAVREVFEESGVLYANVDADVARKACALMREGRSFGEVLEAMDLRIKVDGLAPFTRWITPVIGGTPRKRFDARFFLAAAPEGQEPVHDAVEAVESEWVRPKDALTRAIVDRRILLAAPQVMSLVQLSSIPDVQSALRVARSRPPPTVLPHSVNLEDGTRMVCYPGDELHSVRERAMPGPTRLCARGGRFEPVSGEFADLFK